MIINLTNLLHIFSDLTRTFEIHVFTLFVGFDILTGIAKGFVNHKANSTKGLTGIIKHFLVVLMIYTIYPYLVLVGAKPIATAFVLFFVACYGISIVENWGQLGLPMPAFVRVFFDKLKRTSDTFDVATIKIDKDGLQVHAPTVVTKIEETREE